MFPAYSVPDKEEKDGTDAGDGEVEVSWLKNVSFVCKQTDSGSLPTAEGSVLEEKEEASSSNEEVVVLRETKPRKRHKKEKDEKKKGKKHRKKRGDHHEKSDEKGAKKEAAVGQLQPKPKFQLLPSLPRQISIEDCTFEDRFRDIQNLQFDSVYKAHLAKYRYPSAIRKLGAGGRSVGVVAVGAEDAGRLAVMTVVRKAERYFSKRKLHRPTADTVIRCAASSKSAQLKKLPEFLPIERFIYDNGVRCEYDVEVNMYRPVERAIQDGASTSGLSSCFQDSLSIVGQPGDSFSADFGDHWLIAETRRFSKALSESPCDVDLWLEFLALQDKMFDHLQTTTASGCSKTKAEGRLSRLSFLERKMAIVDKALEKNVTAMELHALRLDVAQELGWSGEKVASEWRRLEFTHVNKPDVWIGQLRFSRSSFGTFSVSRHLAIFDRCLSRTDAVLRGLLLSHPPLPNTNEFFVDCLLAKVNFLTESGNYEKAVSIVQALVEFNFRQPTFDAKMTLEAKRDVFELFWNSGCPRFAEPGAQGWASFMSKQEAGADGADRAATPAASTSDDELHGKELEIIGTTQESKELWLNLERLRETYMWLPWRSARDEPEDMERIVLFDDISSSLFDLGTEGPEKLVFFLESLQALRLITLPPYQSSNRRLWYEQICSMPTVFQNFDILPKLHENSSFVGRREFFQEFITQGSSLLPAHPWRTFLVYSQLYDRTLSLASDTEHSIKERQREYRSFARQLLEDPANRTCLLLYEMYAYGLLQLQASNEAAKVMRTALELCRYGTFHFDADSVEEISLVRLLYSYAELTLMTGVDPISVATYVSRFLVSGAVHTPVSSAFKVPPSESSARMHSLADALREHWETLKKQYLTRFSDAANCDFLVIGWMGTSLTCMSHLLAIFEYCLTGDVDGSRTVYRETRQVVKQQVRLATQWTHRLYHSFERQLERLYEGEMFLVNTHCQRSTNFGPKLVMAVVAEALKAFPNNVRFLRMFCDFHLRGQLIVKLRNFFDTLCSKGSPLCAIAVIYSEFLRFLRFKEDTGVTSKDDIGRLRHVMDHYTDMYPDFELLWRLWLKFETLFPNGKLEEVAYRAIRSCPWQKAIYCDAGAALPSSGTQMIVDLIVEKQLKLRVPWEEVELLQAAKPAVEESETTPDAESESKEETEELQVPDSVKEVTERD